MVFPPSFFLFFSICVATFVAVPHNLPSAYVQHSCYNVIQIRARIYFMRFARCQQRTDDTHADGRLMVSTEQVVLFYQV